MSKVAKRPCASDTRNHYKSAYRRCDTSTYEDASGGPNGTSTTRADVLVLTSEHKATLHVAMNMSLTISTQTHAITTIYPPCQFQNLRVSIR
eukprot:9492599-Pyramimonas_sp.AAC.1